MDQNFDAPTVYIDGAQNLIAKDSVVQFALIQDSVAAAIPGGADQPPNAVERRVVVRLVMEHGTFAAIAAWMSKIAADAGWQVPPKIEDEK